ncbi:hypothetical protein Tco_0389447 [Tanacetum coccineum]
MAQSIPKAGEVPPVAGVPLVPAVNPPLQAPQDTQPAAAPPSEPNANPLNLFPQACSSSLSTGENQQARESQDKTRSDNVEDDVLYLLEKTYFFLPKPPTLILHDEVALKWQRTCKGLYANLLTISMRSVSDGTGLPFSGFSFNPGSPSGSDVSDSSVRTNSSSHVAAAKTDAAVVDDPPTLLTLSLPGAESSEASSVSAPPAAVAAPPAFDAEFLAVMQEMIRMEVRNYISGDGFRVGGCGK